MSVLFPGIRPVVLPDSLALPASLRVAPRVGRGMVSRLHLIRSDV